MSSIYSQYIIAILLYIAAYIYALKIAVGIGHCNDELCKKINSVHENCIMGCDHKSCALTKSRGSNYFIGITDEEKKANLDRCLVTFWGATHFILYFLLGVLTPDLFWETFTVGVAFEIYEYYKYDCADGLDIILNTIGFLLGQQLYFFTSN
ncbi:MAG: hypothetical protein Harvfovirus63_2 [Harvfovirus sp.]|uniref:Uncharacterized protein n=1 Tax=Harvfovirus sp. TaxID=2487768 RepID=A0A3G5A8U9_9VIRU|nr:MAG: hypothetical protein Harvfovirus63_2 [Harvfovirus sp.]